MCGDCFFKFQFLPNFEPVVRFWIFRYEIQYLTTSIFETFYVRHTKVYGIILTDDINTPRINFRLQDKVEKIIGNVKFQYGM